MLTLNQIRTQVAAIRETAEGARAFGLQIQQAWAGPDQVTVDQVTHRIVQAGSELALREALVESARTGIPVIILTPLAEGALGEDVLARLARRRVFQLSGRELLRQLFGAKDVEPRLRNRRWMAEALVEAQPPGGYPPVPTGRLDEETAWEMLLRHVLGFRGGRPDLAEVLAWSRQPDAGRRLGALAPEAASEVEAWLTRSAGGAVGLVLAALRGVQPVSPVALSLACSVLFAGSPSTELIAARGRVEQYFGGRSPTEAEGQQLAEAARTWIDEEDSPEALRHEGEGLDELLKQLRVDGYAHASDFSPLGCEQRFRRFADDLRGYLAEPGGAALARVEESFKKVECHLACRRDPDRLRRAGMALRLIRWMHQRKPSGPDGLASLAAGYFREGSFVDWARIALYHGDSEPSVTRAYSELVRAVGSHREEENRQFAGALVEADAGATSGLPGVEDVIPDFVAALAAKRRVLLLVVDGMSLAVLRELMETVSRMGFVELVRGDAKESAFGLAGLPTITEWSRRLLLGGREQAAGSQGEPVIFREHPALAGFTGTRTSMLFLKGDLTQTGDVGLSSEVRRQIEGKATVIGVVVNAVDDHLAKGDQLHVPWTLERVPLLHQLL
ncbi:MAG: BREX-2 system phosphatase PglZ, partial [Limisphaerales bacterium]